MFENGLDRKDAIFIMTVPLQMWLNLGCPYLRTVKDVAWEGALDQGVVYIFSYTSTMGKKLKKQFFAILLINIRSIWHFIHCKIDFCEKISLFDIEFQSLSL